jgi:hypothetical protein
MRYYTERRGANHGLHLVLSIFTCGMWAITGWPIAAAIGRRRTVRGPLPPPYYPPPYYDPNTPPPPPRRYGGF